ncbi:hypothetical protein [Kineococcus terrestris]|uniref:hypothetical protein n=1 Tax=Kineococcus terrestris TaxID=2044856 RepID=UPI0034DB3C89
MSAVARATYRSAAPARVRRARLVRAGTAAALVLLNVVAVLLPVLGLVGAAAGAGPLLDVPYLASALAVAAGLLVAVACTAGAYAVRRAAPAWTFVVLAWLTSLAASLWPLVATADAAVDRTRDALPWIAELVRSLT